MKRTLVTALALLAAATLGFTPAIAAEKAATAEKKAEKAEVKDATGKEPAAATADATKAAAGKPFPYKGSVTKVDAAGKTFSLNGAKGKERVFVIDDATKITKDGKPATLADLTVGVAVTGSVLREGEVQTAKSLKIGGAAEAAAAGAGAADPAAKPGSAPLKATPAPEAKPAVKTAAAPAGATPAAKKP